MDYDKIIQQATGGEETISSDSMPASGIRPIIFDDPGLLWLEEYGEDTGFSKDKGKYRLLPYLSKLGKEFEEAFIKNEAPNAVRLLDHNSQVRKKESFLKTIEHLKRGTKVLYQAALWWNPEQIYGVADLIVHTSWLYKRYPHLKKDDEPPHYVIIDLKFSTKLDSAAKKAHLEHASSQIRLYSYMLGHLQNYMPRRGFIISRDTVDSPIVVDIDLDLNTPLNDDLTDLRDAYQDIKLRGADLRPWKDKKVELNPSNKSDEPWHDAKVEILTEKVRPRSLLILPGVGPETARKMHLHGFNNIDDLLLRDIDRLHLEEVDGIGTAMADRIRAVLKANKTDIPCDIPTHLVPKRADIEIMLDTEYLSSLRTDFTDWPNLSGTQMIFLIGCYYRDNGKWVFKRFVAAEETHDAEEKMLKRFLAFLRKQGVFDPSKTAALYTWSGAEKTVFRQASERHSLPQLENLPLIDLERVFLNGPIVLPGMWSFGLKEVADLLPRYYKTIWPEGLGNGQSAQIAAWNAYDAEEPIKSPEMKLIVEYLEQDCSALERILAWLRNSARREKKAEAGICGWYKYAKITLLQINEIPPVEEWQSDRLWYRITDMISDN